MSKRHYAGLDGLRGAAILLVMLYHLFPRRGTGIFGYVCSAGWVGVDLFFVLSGFLITGILYETQFTKGVYVNFYARRALRLFPLYLVFIAVTLVAARGTGSLSWPAGLAYLLYASNIVRFFHPGLGSIGPVGTGHLWSLAVEEQFYLVWPLVVVWLSTRRRILLGCLAGCVAALLLRLGLVRLPFPDYTFLYLELPTRADALLLGGALAMIEREADWKARLRMPLVRVLGGLAAVLFVGTALQRYSFYYGFAPINTWGFSLTAIASGCLLALSLMDGTWTNRVCTTGLLRFFGRYSYGLYLIHYPLSLLGTTTLEPLLVGRVHPVWLAGAMYFCLLLAVCTGLAVLSFRAIELPFLRMKGRFAAPATGVVDGRGLR